MAKHAYRGSRNSRAKRQQSKILKGIKVDKKAQESAFKKIEKEKSQTNAKVQKR